jgi:uncharacterized protein with PQ loop repeat
MDFLEMLQLAGSAGFTIALVPQFFRTLKRRTAADVDLAFLFLVLAASVISLYYAIATDQIWFAISFGANLVVWGTVCYYRLWPSAAPRP